jgi:hypothetical protein
LQPLADLISDLTQQVRQLSEAATLWQVRAVQAEERASNLQERLLALTATTGDDGQDAASMHQDVPGTTEATNATPAATASGLSAWWRRLWGGA